MGATRTERAVENYIAGLQYSDATSADTRTLVAGNIRAAVAALIERGQLAEVPLSTKRRTNA